MATLQLFLERITSKLHSWTVKCLSFASKVKLIYSVIYSMVNFWSSIFVLPKSFYAKVVSLCASHLLELAFLGQIYACRRRREGGLGLRKLEDFDLIFRLKRL